MVENFELISAETLLLTPLEHKKDLVEGLITDGLTIISGSQKVGKSWMALQLCICVANGEPFLDLPTEQGDVLYLSLEDPPRRIQERLFRAADEVKSHLYFATHSLTLNTGLTYQIRQHLDMHPETRLVVIDTLQKVRLGGGESSYASDYEDLSKIKEIADEKHVAIVLVHHVRKEKADDPHEMVSGTTGITGCADSSFVICVKDRLSDTATLSCTGRDIEVQDIEIRFTPELKWEFVSRKSRQDLAEADAPEFMTRLADFVLEKGGWSGTSTELIAQLEIEDIKPNVLSKYVNQFHSTFLKSRGIEYQFKRTASSRVLTFKVCDDSDGNDDK